MELQDPLSSVPCLRCSLAHSYHHMIRICSFLRLSNTKLCDYISVFILLAYDGHIPTNRQINEGGLVRCVSALSAQV